MKTVTDLAQQIADQELAACREWLTGKDLAWIASQLHFARQVDTSRTGAPTLKEQALEALEALPTPAGQVTADRLDTIRRALEALPE